MATIQKYVVSRRNTEWNQNTSKVTSTETENIKQINWRRKMAEMQGKIFFLLLKV